LRQLASVRLEWEHLFVQAKRVERLRARRLRADGWPLRRIAAELEVALSTVSVWTRDVALPASPDSHTPPRPEPAGTRRCSRCQQELPTGLFNRHPSGLQWYCRPCFRSYYEDDRSHHQARSSALKERRVDQARAFVTGYLTEHACTDCDVHDPVILEFDHVGAKSRAISDMVCRGTAVDRIRAEVAKCEVVCANCHRRRTARRAGWARLDLGERRRFRSSAQERNVLHCWCRLLVSGCVECREVDLVVLDFDHLGEKRASVMRLAESEVSLRRLEDEIRRCVVRCANCHRRHTARDAGHYRAVQGTGS
jgi:hypothetical protein